MDGKTTVSEADFRHRGKSSQASAEQSVANYVEQHRVPIVTILALVVAGVIGYTVSSVVSSRANESALAKIDAAEKALTAASSSLDGAALGARRTKAKEALKPFIAKSGIAGVRANMLAAEIAWQEGSYGDAEEYWRAASAKSRRLFGKASYTAPLALFNEAVVLENSGKVAEAAALYGEAAEAEDFMLRSCAIFNKGRAYEACGEWLKAQEAYNDLVASSPNDTWANLARSRLIALEVAGKVE